jgi:hypothetical protein
MHDIDRVREELAPETFGEFEAGEFEAAPFTFNESGEVFNETENMELASELLEVTSEAELENFIGDLVAKAGRSLGQFVGSPEGKALVGVLKGAAHKVLPTLGASVGRYLGDDAGARLGAQAAAAAGRAFGLELEGLSNEDREFETARRYVNFAGEAVRNLVDQSAQAEAETASLKFAVPPGKAAMLAAGAAARTHAPGLLTAALAGMPKFQPSPTAGGERSSGRWVRQGGKIILFGV